MEKEIEEKEAKRLIEISKRNRQSLDVIRNDLFLQSHKKLMFVFCMGITCSGKSTLVKSCTDNHEEIGAITVGTEMRKRHTATRFNGLAAMQDTEEEVWDIFTEQLDDNIRRGKRIIIVDGQPRMASQVSTCNSLIDEFDAGFIFLLVSCSDDCIRDRISRRFDGDLDSIDLSVKRITNDKVQLYETIVEIISCNNFLVNISSEQEDYCDAVLKKLLEFSKPIKPVSSRWTHQSKEAQEIHPDELRKIAIAMNSGFKQNESKNKL